MARSTKTIEVLPPGAEVRIVGTELTGRISTVAIRGTDCVVTYRVAYWSGATRAAVWRGAEEITAETGERRLIGFAAQARLTAPKASGQKGERGASAP